MLRTVTSRSVLARASCEGGEVTGSSTVDFNGNAIGLVSTTCSQSGSKKRSMIEARQYDLCSEGDCECFPQLQLRVNSGLLGQRSLTENACSGYPTCEDTTDTDIILDDCATVLEYLASYGCKLPNLHSVQTILLSALSHDDLLWDGQPRQLLYPLGHPRSGTLAHVPFTSTILMHTTTPSAMIKL